MFIHAEPNDGDILSDDEISAFLRKVIMKIIIMKLSYLSRLFALIP